MMKRNILLITLILIVVLASIVGYMGLKQDPDVASPYEAMPPSTIAVLTVNNYSRTFENLLLNNLMWQELILDKDVHELAAKLILLDSLIKNKEWSAEISQDIKWHIAFHPTGNGIENSLIIPMSNLDFTQMEDWILGYSKSISDYGVFEDVEIKQCVFSSDLFEPVYYCYIKGLFIASNKANFVEDDIRSLVSKSSLYGNEKFKKVERTSGTFANWNFFVNYQNMSGLKLLGLNVQELMKSNIIWSDWTALDATVHPDLILFNGFSYTGNESYLSLFEKQKPQDIDAIEIIPDDVSLFFYFGISNYKKYSEAKRAYFKSIGKDKAYREKVESLKTEFQIDLEMEFDQLISNEFGVMFLPNESIDAVDSKVAFFRLSDIRRTQVVLGRMSGVGDDGIVSDIPRLLVDDFLNDFESVLFDNFDRPYYLILDKYLLISSHHSLLKKIKKQYLQAKTLKKSEMYARFSGNLSDQSNVYIYIRLESGKSIYKDILNEKSLSFLNNNPDFLEKFEQIGMQFKDSKKDMFYQHMAMNFNPKQRSQGNVLWEAILDTDLIMKPQIVYNHYSNAREILVQDVQNTIYLIDNKGNLLWKRRMKEKIKSKVYQIDVYKNNKLQMLFSGESSIYLLDRKGRDVENFPVQLPAVATNELKVIDYEKNREYRILICVRGGEILNFDRFGKKIKGWSFKSSEEITYPIDYFLLNGKDYIVTVGSEGKPYIINRKGEERIKIDEKLPPFSGRGYKLELSNDINQCKFVTTDESGNFIKLKFNGEKETVNLDLISENHQFLYDDLNNDRKNDYILLDSNRLMVYNHSREKVFEIELEGNDPANLSMYKFDSGIGKIGFTDIESSQVYLYRDAGGLDNNFPLKGSTSFSIIDLNKDGGQNVIVGLKNRLVVYNLK